MAPRRRFSAMSIGVTALIFVAWATTLRLAETKVFALGAAHGVVAATPWEPEEACQLAQRLRCGTRIR